MAELSFGHNLRAKRKEVVTNTLSFLPWAQGCLTACVANNPQAALDGPAPANTVFFKDAPAKMLGIALHEYGAALQFKIQLCNLPRELRDHEVLVQVQAASINPMDCKLRSGALQQLYPLSLPVILGCDMSGVVVKAGNKAPFSPGQHVFGRQTLERIREVNGAYAEFCVADGKDLCLKPEDVSFEDAAAVPWAGLTALGAIEHTGGIGYKNSTGGRRAVLVLGGSGGVGSLAIQIAKHYMRCYVAATASTVNQRFLKELGADEAINYTDPDFWSGIQKPQLGQGKEGFNLVIDCVGGDDYWERAQELLTDDGHYVTLVGPHRYGSDAMTVGSALNTQMTSNIRKGLGLLGASKKYTVFTPSMTKSEDLEVLSKLLKENTITPTISKVYSMYDIMDAHEHMDSHHAVGKCILQVRKGVPEDDKDEGSQPDEDDDNVDLRDMVLDKETMRLVPRSKANQSGMGDDLKKQQMEVAARLLRCSECVNSLARHLFRCAPLNLCSQDQGSEAEWGCGLCRCSPRNLLPLLRTWVSLSMI